MKTLRALPVVLIGAVILGCVSCRNYDFSESLEDDFEITCTSTEESIGTFTSSNDVLVLTTETTDGNDKNISVASGVTIADQEAQGSNSDNQGHERDNSANEDNGTTVSVPTSTPFPQSEHPVATSTTVSVSSPTTSTETPRPTVTPVPTATSTPAPTNTPVPTATPTPEPTSAPTPTPKPVWGWKNAKGTIRTTYDSATNGSNIPIDIPNMPVSGETCDGELTGYGKVTDATEDAVWAYLDNKFGEDFCGVGHLNVVDGTVH